MKKLLMGGLLTVCVVLLSSCLDGSGDGEHSSYGFGVVEYTAKAGGNAVYYNDSDYPLFSSTLSAQINDGECCYFQYTYKNADNPDPATLGYHRVTFSQYYDIETYTPVPYKRDTAVVLSNELEATEAAAVGFIKNYLFVQSAHSAVGTNQKNNLELSFDYNAAPVVESGKNVYQLYYRVTKTADGTSPTSTQYMYGAFNIGQYFNIISNQEKNKGNTQYHFKINYIKSFDSDSIPTWASTQVYDMSIGSES